MRYKRVILISVNLERNDKSQNSKMSKATVYHV